MKSDHYILFHYSFDKLAGTERVIYNLIEFLATRKGAKITLLLAGIESALALDLSPFPVEVVYLGEKIEVDSGFRTLKVHSRLFFKLLSFLKKYYKKDENYICLATNPFLAVLMWSACRFKNCHMKAIVACEHFSITVAGKLSLLARKAFYKYFHVVTLTEKDRIYLAREFKPLSCTCIPNAIPFKLRSYTENEHDQSILSIGRITQQKGFDLLIQAFSKIAAKYPSWRLKIVGDDYGDKEKLLRLIEHYKLNNSVTIFPATSKIGDYYKNASFYVLSSRFEGLPMVMLEATGFGLPIVAFDCPTGPAELVDDSNGVLVENGNVDKLADSIQLLMDNKALLLQKAKGAEERAKLYAKERINKLWEDLFSRISANNENKF